MPCEELVAAFGALGQVVTGQSGEGAAPTWVRKLTEVYAVRAGRVALVIHDPTQVFVGQSWTISMTPDNHVCVDHEIDDPVLRWSLAPRQQ